MISDYHNITEGRVEFSKSLTRENLMRAFAGESQARNRYTFAAGQAKREQLTVISKLFEFTAGQELSHAKVFYSLLSDVSGTTVPADGTYPVDLCPDTLSLLRAAQHNEYQEWEHDYARFARIARDEGFDLIGHQFELISAIEKIHGDRFGYFADLLERDRLFSDDREVDWMCLNCGRIIRATAAPSLCPVCRHGQDWFIRSEPSPFSPTVR